MLKILGIPIKVKWNQIEPGMSFFVPCLDSEEVAKYLTWDAARFKYRVICKQVLENGKYGLRCWRVE